MTDPTAGHDLPKPLARQESPEPPGLQPERTRLAWRRTTLSTIAVLLLGLSTALTHQLPEIAWGALAVAALSWLGIIVVAYRRIAALSRQTVRVDTIAPAYLALLALLVTIASALVVAAVAATGAHE